MEDCGFERSTGVWREDPPRIGRRQQVGTPVHWRLLDRHSVLGRSVLPADAPPDHQAILHDLSVTGARLFAPTASEIVAGCGLELKVGQQWSFVEVAWIAPSPAPQAQWCGVRFVQPSQRFIAEVFQALDSLDPT